MTSKLQVPIHIQEPLGSFREKVLIRVGIPIPRGRIFEDSSLSLTDGDNLLPTQIYPILKWIDGSIKWIYVEGLLSCLRGGEERVIFLISAEGIPLFDNSKEEDLFFPKMVLTFQGDKQKKESISILWKEENGPPGHIYRASAEIFSRGKKSINTVLQKRYYPQLSLGELDLVVHNPYPAHHRGGIWELGDKGSICFRDISLCFEHPEDAQGVEYCVTPGGDVIQGPIPIKLFQSSSGGKNWRSPNHILPSGEYGVDFCGYKIEGPEGNLKKGKRATPFFKIRGKDYSFIISCDRFWENFPGTIEIKRKNTRVGVFPGENSSGFELQGGEQKRHTLRILGPLSPDIPLANARTWLLPIYGRASCEWIAASRFFSFFSSPHTHNSSSTPIQLYENYISSIIQGKHSFFQKREIIDEYGWRNFGDIYADHESHRYQGKDIFVSHYNNQYDFLMGAALQFLKTGDQRWFDLLIDGARHTIDIDIYHTDGDRIEFNHGLFWHTDHYREAGLSTHRTYSGHGMKKEERKRYGGGPCNEHIYTTGLLYYYLLTRDVMAYKAIMEIAQWVIDMDRGRASLLGVFDESPTGKASSTVFQDYHGPGRGAGNSINALLDAYEITNNRQYIKKAEELIQRCVHPNMDLEKLHLEDAEHRWSYLVFLQALGKYLGKKEGIEEFDYYFFYARDSLLLLAQWILDNERPYLDVQEKLEIPSETWSAQDIRKCWVLNIASLYVEDEKKAVLYREKAAYFFQRSIQDLLSYPTSYYTRAQVLMVCFGWIQEFFDFHVPTIAQSFPSKKYSYGDWKEFVPQAMAWKSRFSKKLKMAWHYIRALYRSRG